MKLSVANGQYDLKNQITADVHIKSLGDCNYALQVIVMSTPFHFSKRSSFSFEMFILLKLKMKMNQLSRHLHIKISKILLFVFVGSMDFLLLWKRMHLLKSIMLILSKVF